MMSDPSPILCDMKRSGPLRRKTPLRSRGNTKYRRRPRNIPYMMFVKRLPCVLRELPPFTFSADPSAATFGTTCRGRVEADHLGDRGIGQKASDDTVAPLCKFHHGARHDHKADFWPLTRDELRAWRTAAIERTQAAWGAK